MVRQQTSLNDPHHLVTFPGFYTPKQAAHVFRKTKQTILNWCEAGILGAIPVPYGERGRMTYKIPRIALEHLMQQRREAKRLITLKPRVSRRGQQKDLINDFRQCLADGALDRRRVYSELTIQYYAQHLERFFEKHNGLTAESADLYLTSIPAHQFATREKFHRAAVCFGKFLIKRHMLDPEELPRIQALKPVCHLPPKRYTLTEEQVICLIRYAGTLEKAKWPNYAILCLLFGTGIRSGELCNLKLQHLDLADSKIYVEGKWGTGRELGLPPFVLNALVAWLGEREKRVQSQNQSHVFLNKEGKPLSRYGVRTRLHKLGLKIAVPVHPHALRRTFVTVNAGRGVPMEYLRIACGHKKISTTEGYCNTEQRIVVERMKTWDLDLRDSES